MDEVPVEACIDKADDDLRDTIPVLIDVDVDLTWWFGHVRWNPLKF